MMAKYRVTGRITFDGDLEIDEVVDADNPEEAKENASYQCNWADFVELEFADLTAEKIKAPPPPTMEDKMRKMGAPELFNE